MLDFMGGWVGGWAGGRVTYHKGLLANGWIQRDAVDD